MKSNKNSQAEIGSNVKKVSSSKLKPIKQANTLLNYFQKVKNPSDGTLSPQDDKSDLEIVGCFGASKVEAIIQTRVDMTGAGQTLTSDCDTQFQVPDENVNFSLGKNEWAKIFAKADTKKDTILEKTEPTVDNKPDKPEKQYKKCPFYKFISNTPITVDAFNFGIIDNCTAYFLSHFHYDHYIGLNRHFSKSLYCSEITGNLVTTILKVDPKYVIRLPMYEFVNIFENDARYQVALLDANHCPGSVMFLFYLKNTRQYILHTGDFRASERVVMDRFLSNIKIETLYLDTTYCDSYYKFETQEKIIALGVHTIKTELKKYPKSLVVCGSYTIGKERIYVEIAEEIQSKICVKRDKKKIIECLNDKRLKNLITLNPKETNLHVLPMGNVNIKDLIGYLANFSEYDRIIGIKPTGWTHTSDSGLSVDSKKDNAIVYGLAYSEHSSFSELKNFVQFHKPKTILPTVNNGSKETRDKMTKYFAEWLMSNK